MSAAAHLGALATRAEAALQNLNKDKGALLLGAVRGIGRAVAHAPNAIRRSAQAIRAEFKAGAEAAKAATPGERERAYAETRQRLINQAEEAHQRKVERHQQWRREHVYRPVGNAILTSANFVGRITKAAYNGGRTAVRNTVEFAGDIGRGYADAAQRVTNATVAAYHEANARRVELPHELRGRLIALERQAAVRLYARYRNRNRGHQDKEDSVARRASAHRAKKPSNSTLTAA